MSTSQDQVGRLLALVPYLVEHPDADLAGTAVRFQVSEQQLRKDLGVLWFVGLPYGGMGDLIDVDFDHLDATGKIRITGAEYLRRPLRLQADEAVAVVAALHALADVAPGRDRAVIESALTKVTGAASGAVTAHIHVDDPDPGLRTKIDEALESGRAMHLSYEVESRDQVTERDVDPLHRVVTDGRQYLQAWCRRAEAVRLFRLDRIRSATVLDEPNAAPEQATSAAPAREAYVPGTDDVEVRLRLQPGAAWIADYYPCTSLEAAADGTVEVTMTVADLGWLERLVLRQGGAAEVLAPPDWAAAIGDRARAALKAYG